jgi:hypothetical protein
MSVPSRHSGFAVHDHDELAAGLALVGEDPSGRKVDFGRGALQDVQLAARAPLEEPNIAEQPNRRFFAIRSSEIL